MSIKITKSLILLTISEIIFNLSGYIIHSVLGRVLGPEDYGRYALVVTLTTTIIILIGNGIPTAMSKYISEVYDGPRGSIRSIKRSAIFIQSLLVSCVTVVFFLLSPFVAFLLGDATLTPLFQLSSLIIPAFAAASFYFSYFTGLHKFPIQALLKTIRSIARVIFILLLALFFGVEGAIGGYIFAPLLVFFIALALDVYLGRENTHQEKQPKEIPFDWHKLLQFAWPITLFMLFYELMISIDLFLVKRMLADDALTGIYNAALTLGRIPYFLFYALTILLFPTISHATARKDTSKTQSIVKQSILFQMTLLIPLSGLLLIYAHPLIELFYGGAYVSAVESFQILVVGASMLTIFYVMTFVFNGAGKTHFSMMLALLGLILNTTLNILCIPKFGLLGAAYATTATSAVILLATLIFVYKQFGVTISLLNFFKIALSSTLVLSAAYYLPHQTLWEAILFGSVLFATHLLLVYVLRIFSREDYQKMLQRKTK